MLVPFLGPSSAFVFAESAFAGHTMAIPAAPPVVHRKRGNPNWGRPIPPVLALATEFETQVKHLHLTAETYVYSADLRLSDHPKPATDYHLKTGQRE